VSAPAVDPRAVDDWFLGRGLPLVLTRRVRSRALIPRSAPAVAGVGALTAAPVALETLHRRSTSASRVGRRTTALAVMAVFVLVMPA